MLKSLYINNFAIIKEIELQFHPGMSALTGETGAGKSIIIDAINLVIGDRTDRNMIADDSQRLEVVATFDTSDTPIAATWLKEHDLDRDTECVLRRVVNPDGKSKAYINNSPCTINIMKDLGELFINIYGQHEHQYLMHKDKQRDLVDSFSNNSLHVNQLSALFRQLQNMRKLLLENKSNENNLSLIDFLKFQIDEIDKLKFTVEEYEQLKNEHKRLNNIAELREGILKIYDLIGDETENGASTKINLATSELERLSSIDTKLIQTCTEFQVLQDQIKDSCDVLRDYAEGLDSDPQSLRKVEDRLAAIEDIAHKHKTKPVQLTTTMQSLQSQLAQIEKSYIDPEQIKKDLEQIEMEYRALARQISSTRKSAAKELNQKITDAIHALGMQAGRFYIDIQPKKDGHYSATGLDDIQFLVCTNPGQTLRPLSKVASGGELSRISLAIQMVAADFLQVPSLIFDEVDSGVGGAVAEVVGTYLRQLGTKRQVFCVTHLPQVAAQAHQHYKVQKIAKEKSTSINIKQLDDEQRVGELARMLGGIEMTKNTEAHAQEMFSRAQASN